MVYGGVGRLASGSWIAERAENRGFFAWLGMKLGVVEVGETSHFEIRCGFEIE